MEPKNYYNDFKKSQFWVKKSTTGITFKCRWIQKKQDRPFDWVIIGIDRRKVMNWPEFPEGSGTIRHTKYVYRINFFGFSVNIWKIRTLIPKGY